MKVLILSLLVTLSSVAFGQQGSVDVSIEFRGIEKGYDHTTRDELYVDGKLLLVTEERLESKAIKLNVQVPRGKHTIKIVNWVMYEGVWEENNVENNYSLDSFREIECNFRKKGQLTVVYDLNESEVIMKYK